MNMTFLVDCISLLVLIACTVILHFGEGEFGRKHPGHWVARESVIFVCSILSFVAAGFFFVDKI